MSSVGTPSTPSIQWQCHWLNWWNKNLWNILKWIRTLEDWNNIEKWFVQNYSLSENLSWRQLIQEPFGRSVQTCAKIKIFNEALIVVRCWGVEMFPIICCSNNVTYWNCGCITRLFHDSMNNIGPTITAQSRPGASDLGIKNERK